ncbi:MAG: LamG domain-containing protein [Deltaproteobacteria bacterium]|nr:LamG domain-containing protein [Deltaproteobacteria bacterium]
MVRDGSSYGNDGTATGVSTVPDLDGMAAQFSGAAMISIPPAASLNPPTEFTLDAWVRPVTLPAAGARYGVFDRNGQFGMFLMDTGELRCSATNVVTGGSIPVNVWTHVACVISPTAVELYVNGLLAVTAARSGALNTGNQDVVAVGANSPSGDSFQGRLDRVRLWQTAHPANRVCTQ